MKGIAKHIKLLAIVVIFLFIIILIFIFPRNQLLTSNELNTLISEKEIKPISTNDIGNSYTDIVYKDEKSNDRLELIAYKNRWGKVKTKQYAFFKSGRINKVDVEYWETKPFSYDLDGYVGIEILSEDSLGKAKSAEVVLDNGLVVRASFKASNILLIQAKRKFFWEKPKLKSIEIYDDKGSVIDGFYKS